MPAPWPVAGAGGAEAAAARGGALLLDQKGSPAYVSPEVLVCRPYDGAAADVWALGVVLYIMLTGTYPFQDNKPARLFDKIQQAWRAVAFPDCVSPAARDLIKQLLTRQPERRPSAEDLLSHPWVSGITVAATSPASGTAVSPAGTAAALVAASADDCVVPNLGSPALARKRRCPDLPPLVIPAASTTANATVGGASAATSPSSPMSVGGGTLQHMWTSPPSEASPSAVVGAIATAAKRRRGSGVSAIELAFALKAAQQQPSANDFTASSQPPSPPPPMSPDAALPVSLSIA